MILSRKYEIAIIMAVIIFIPNVSAIKMSVSSGNGVSYSGDYRMATSASLQNNILLSGEGIFQDTKASGKGKNAIIQSIGGNGYNGESSLVTSGSFSTSSSSVATSNAGMISQDVSADGDAAIGTSASTASSTAVQQASVNNGALSSSQILAMGGSAVAGQNVVIAGDSGTIDFATLSSGDQAKTVNAYFVGGGNLNAQLASRSGQSSGMQGTASFNGIEVINNDVLSGMKSGEAMAVEGAYVSQKGLLGSFGLSALTSKSIPVTSSINNKLLEKVTGEITKEGANPEIISAPLGDATSYRNWKAFRINKPVQLYLLYDTNLVKEGVDPVKTAKAVSSAAQTWDYWTKPNQNNLFQPSVIIDPTKRSDKKDGNSVVSFDSGSSIASTTWLAYTRIWTNNGLFSEADMVLNTGPQWTTDLNIAANSGAIDVQSVALHELGHFIGLADIYNLPQNDPRSSDIYEAMHNYGTPQRNLGLGDIAGVREIYGK
jgi:hypothetical protein